MSNPSITADKTPWYQWDTGQTYVEQAFEVIARNIPADYIYTKTAQKTIRDAETVRDQAVQVR